MIVFRAINPKFPNLYRILEIISGRFTLMRIIWSSRGTFGCVSQWEIDDRASIWKTARAKYTFTFWSISNSISFIGIWCKLCLLSCTIRSSRKSFSKQTWGIRSFGTRIEDDSADIILESRSSVWFETCLSVSTKNIHRLCVIANDCGIKLTFELNTKNFTLK